MRTLHFILAGDPATRTGSYAYLRRVVAGLRARGREIVQHVLPGDFPSPGSESLAKAERTLAALPDGATAVIDGSALGGMPEIVQRHAGRLRLAGLVHHPLARETGISEAEARRFLAGERQALAAVARVVVSSPHTGRVLAGELGVAADRIAVVTPGTDPAPLAAGSGTGNGNAAGLALLCVASYTPRKGYPVLFEALAGLANRDWTLVCAGSRRDDPETAREIQALAAAHPAARRITLLDEMPPDDLAGRYHAATLFVMASHYEGYGMVLSEAIARGLPIVSTTGGAIPDTVPEGAGLLVPPGDAGALAEALARTMDDAALRAALRAASARARETLPDWDAATAAFDAAVRELEAES